MAMNPHAYDKLFCRFVAAIQPSDALEWRWLKELADGAWEWQRAKGLRDRLFNAWRQEAIRVLVVNCLDGGSVKAPSVAARHAAYKWNSTGARGERALRKFLAQYGESVELVRTLVLAKHSDSLRRFDSAIAALDQQRDLVLQEIDCRIPARSTRFRQAVAEVIESRA